MTRERDDRNIASEARNPAPVITEAKSAKRESLDDILLKLEMSLGIASPASAEGARRALKLQAMKNALEGRKSAVPVQADFLTLSADALGWRHINDDQGRRLEAVLAALKLSGPEHLQK